MNRTAFVVMLLIVFAVIISVGAYEFAMNNQQTPPVNASTNVTTYKLMPGERLDIGDASAVVHYVGFQSGVGYKFSVATFIDSYAGSAYTYDVYADNGVTFCLGSRYYKVVGSDGYTMTVTEVKP